MNVFHFSTLATWTPLLLAGTRRVVPIRSRYRGGGSLLDSLLPVAVTVANPDTLKTSRNDLFRYYHGIVNFDVKSLPVGSNPEGIAVGELTGDAVLDLVAVNRKSNNFHVFVGAQDGSFTLQPGSPISVGGSSPGGGVIGNLDGKPGGELLLAFYLDRAYGYYLNQGGGKLMATTSLSSASTYAQGVTVADVDRDGNLDVVGSTQSSGNPVNGYAIVHYGDGKGAFPVTSSYGVFQSNLTHIVVGSFNKRDDDVLDLATVRNDTCNVLVFLGTGQRDFPAKVNPFAVPVGKDPSDLVTGDWNGDGRTDLAVANSGKFPSTCANPATDNVGLLLGTGDGGFSTMKTFPAHQNPRSLGAADFNRDGKLDLVVGNHGSSDISLLLGRGDGTFLAPQHIPGGSGVNRLVVADFNGDQKPDVATVDNGPDPGTLSVYLNIAK